MQHRLEAGTRQEMLLLPRMLQSIELLQLPTAELGTFLREAFERNEALQLVEPEVGRGAPDPGRRRGTRADSDRHDEMLQAQPARERGLADVVEDQLALLDLGEPLGSWVRLLAGCLDDSGYLSAGDEDLLRIARESGLAPDPALLGRAMGVLQSLEPRGIGGRSAVEALLLQLDPGDGDYELLCRLLEDCLEEVAQNKLPGVARSLGIELERLGELLATLRTLDPRPLAGWIGEAAPPIHPEVVVEPEGDGFSVRVDRSSLPALRVDEQVGAMARDREQPGAVRKYLRGKLEQARFLVRSLEQRHETLLAVARCIFRRQSGFLEHGPGNLAPLRMGEVAEELGVHVSTISRSVAGKYVQSPWGVHALRWFFQSPGAGGADCAREDVRDVLRRAVEAEDKSSPLSDDDLAVEMARRGHPMARRTVAKYRTELGIPSSYRRRRF